MISNDKRWLTALIRILTKVNEFTVPGKDKKTTEITRVLIVLLSVPEDTDLKPYFLSFPIPQVAQAALSALGLGVRRLI
jgi:hypothetical protein